MSYLTTITPNRKTQETGFFGAAFLRLHRWTITSSAREESVTHKQFTCFTNDHIKRMLNDGHNDFRMDITNDDGESALNA